MSDLQSNGTSRTLLKEGGECIYIHCKERGHLAGGKNIFIRLS